MVVAFHATTSVLFNIGLFPVIMVACATVFFAPSWPRRPLRQHAPDLTSAARAPLRGVAAVGVAAWCAFQLLMPARHWLYPGDVLWNEQGMRWSWKVMVREKNGSITYRVRWRGRARESHVPPTRYLTDHQTREFSGQPDMILSLAHHIGREHQRRGLQDVEVRVDALVSLNGRPPAPLIDPEVDLMKVQDSLAPASWILPAPTRPPPRLGTR